MDVSIATGDTRKCPAARKIEQVLPETMAVVSRAAQLQARGLKQMAGVTGDIEAKSIMLGSPALEIRRYRRAAALFKNFPEMLERIKRLERFANFEPPSEAAAVTPGSDTPESES